MKLRTRIMLASGFFRYGDSLFLLFGATLDLAFMLQYAFIPISVIWLIVCRRLVRMYLLPPLFPYAKCYTKNCRRRIPLKQRWRCSVDQWTDCQERHALAVYSDRQHEIRSFNCPYCESTIALQKGDRDLYRRWTPIKTISTAAARTTRPEHGLRFGFDRHFEPGLLRRWWRWLRGHPIFDPVIISNDVLGKHGTIFGSTGSGKSTLVLNLAQQMFRSGDGVTTIDPAGDLSRDLLKLVAPERLNDVIYIDVSDQEFPFPFNILHAQDTNERNLLVDEVLGIFKTMYARSWGESLAHQLRMALNAVLEFGGSFKDVYDLISNTDARARIIRRIKNKELKRYWQDTFPSTSFTSRQSIINKLEPIVKHPFLGPILCSKSCAFDADDVIRSRKILIVNLATGTRADYTAQILGTFVINKIVSAAYRQSSIKDPQKRVRHFFIVDEFQVVMNRASAWDRSLSELRKFKLCLLLVTQFVEQVSEDIRAAIFGNVGFLVAFRVGHRDSKILKDEFEATKQDLLDLGVGECLVRVGTHPMSMRTEPPPTPGHDSSDEIIERMHKMIGELRKHDVPQTPVPYPTDTQELESVTTEEELVEEREVVLCDFA